MPALLTSTSTRPSWRRACSTTRRAVLGLRDVGGDRDAAAAERLDLVRGLLQPVGAAGADGDVGAGLGQPDGERGPEAGGGAGDDGDLAVEAKFVQYRHGQTIDCRDPRAQAHRPFRRCAGALARLTGGHRPGRPALGDHRRGHTGRQLHLRRGRTLGRATARPDDRATRHRPRLRRRRCASRSRPASTCRPPTPTAATAPTSPRSVKPPRGRRGTSTSPVRARRPRTSCARAARSTRPRRPRPTSSRRSPLGRDVKLVVLSIGGNDLGFSSIITPASWRTPRHSGACTRPSRDPRRAMPAARSRRARRSTDPRGNGRPGTASSSYRLVVQSYPSPVPRASENRYPEGDDTRLLLAAARSTTPTSTGRATRWSTRSQQPRGRRGRQGRPVPEPSRTHSRAARTAPTTDSAGHRARSRRQPGRERVGAGAELELDRSGQGQTQEVFHPNAFGQRALGICLKRVFRLIPGQFDCTSGPGSDPEAMSVARTATTASGRTLLRDALRRAVVPTAGRANIARVLKAGGYRAAFSNAVGPGRLLLAWYRVPAGEPVPKPASVQEPVLVARVRVSVTKTGTAHYTVRLKAGGRRLLRATTGSIGLAGRATFTPKGGRRSRPSGASGCARRRRRLRCAGAARAARSTACAPRRGRRRGAACAGAAYSRGEREVVGDAAAAVHLDRAVEDLQRDVRARRP